MNTLNTECLSKKVICNYNIIFYHPIDIDCQQFYSENGFATPDPIGLSHEYLKKIVSEDACNDTKKSDSVNLEMDAKWLNFKYVI